MDKSAFPKPGFYYHYKHDPLGSFENYAYEVLGVGHHTEMPHEEALDATESMFVVYRPLYEDAFVYRNGKMFDVRPLRLFMEDIEKNGKMMKRFTPITEHRLTSLLQEQVRKIYCSMVES